MSQRDEKKVVIPSLELCAVLPQCSPLPEIIASSGWYGIDAPRSADVCASGSHSGGCATWSRSGGLTCLASRMSGYAVMDVRAKGATLFDQLRA